MFASGECGNFISLRRIEEDTLELRQPTTWMRVPSIGETDSAEWPTGGAPVRQICFSRTIEEKATWMAARFASSTIIFRPLYHREPVSMHFDRLLLEDDLSVIKQVRRALCASASVFPVRVSSLSKCSLRRY